MEKTNKWSFQLLPNTPNVLGKGFRVDPVTQALEDEVNDALKGEEEHEVMQKMLDEFAKLVKEPNQAPEPTRFERGSAYL